MSFYLSSTDSSQIVGLILMKLGIIDITVFLSSNFNRFMQGPFYLRFKWSLLI